MRVCSDCGHPIDESEFGPANPMEVLAELFQKSVRSVDDSGLCQTCKKEFGMLNLIGFSE